MTDPDGGRGREANPQNEDAFAQLVGGFFDIWSSGAAAFAKKPGGTESAANAADALGALSLLSRVQSAAALSALRYWSSLTQACGARQSSFLRLMSARGPGLDLPEDERLAILEDVRACLREIGELSSREARLFQSELEKLGEDFASTADASTGPGEYRRRWKYKP